jgi:hypothetical protein
VNTTSGILFFAAFLPYVWAILNHQTAPSPVSWAIWASVDTLTLLAMKKEKASVGQLAGAVAGAWFITALALAFGKPSIGSVEWISISGALLGVILWRRTGNAMLAIICAQAAMFAGALPTFVHGYRRPEEENPIAWLIWFLSCICALIAIRKKWNLANALQPLTFTAIETTMVILVVIRPRL